MFTEGIISIDKTLTIMAPYMHYEGYKYSYLAFQQILHSLMYNILSPAYQYYQLKKHLKMIY